MGFLRREGLLETAIYSNSPDTDLFLDEDKPTYLGGMLLMLNERHYEKWAKLEDSLVTGKHQSPDDVFSSIYQTPESIKLFSDCVGALQYPNFAKLSSVFDFSKYKTLLDVGGSGA